MNRPLLAAVPALLLAGCGPILYAQLEVQQVKVNLPDETFPGTPAGTPLVKDLSYDLAADLPVITEKGVTYDLRLTEMALTLGSTSNLADFRGIQSVTITAVPPAGSGLSEVAVVDYQRGPAPATPLTSVVATGQSNVDLAPYVQAGHLGMRVTAVEATDVPGAGLPTVDWTASVTGTFYLKVKLDYSSYVPL